MRLGKNAWTEHHGKNKLNFTAELDVPAWPKEGGFCKLADIGKSCPAWNTKTPPGHRKFDVLTITEEMACIIIVIHFN